MSYLSSAPTALGMGIVFLAGCGVSVQDGPDASLSRYPLQRNGFVVIRETEDRSEYTLHGCMTETDGVAFEVRPVMEIAGDKSYRLEFTCRIQSFLVDFGEVFEAGDRTLLPVATLHADNTSFPFLDQEAVSYSSDRLPDGTLEYSAVFSVEEWKLRDICVAQQLLVSSDVPEFRMIFGDNERRLLQQFYDIFVIHDGEPPALPVGSFETE